MKKILFISGILVILVACSSEKVNFSQLQDRSGVFYLVNKDKPFSGDVVSYVNGRVEFEGQMNKGLRESTWIYYYPNGQKKMEGLFKEGVKDGTWTYWKDNGQQEGTETYKYGKVLSNEGTVPQEVKTDTAKTAVATTPVEAAKATPPPEPKKVEKKQVAVVWENLHGGPVKFYNGVPYTGPVVKYQKNGLKEFDGNMLRGKKSGKWVLYDKKGNIKDVKYY
jgi:antitoxin component YwqK of YwqJK toxin-antitoxin module